MIENLNDKKTNWSRVPDKYRVAELDKKIVLVIGLGSLGSVVTDLLVKAGVHHLVLVDPDELGDSNITRHLLGMSDLNKPKVVGMQEYILQERNPDADIVPIQTKAEEALSELASALESLPDMAFIAGLGSQNTQAFITYQLLSMGVPTLVAGLYEGAKAGELFYLDPHQGPCYNCVSHFFDRTVDIDVARQGEFLYGLDEDEFAAVPGLATDITLMAAICAKKILDMLIGLPFSDQDGVNLMIHTQEAVTMQIQGELIRAAALSTMMVTVPKYEVCMVCGDVEDAQVVSINSI